MTKRLFFLAIFAGLLSLAWKDDAPGTVKPIVKGVWFREGDFQHFGHCNNVIIEMKDYLIVVDANFPSGARAAMADAKKLSTKPVKYVFDTHHHGDHAYGNAVWTQNGVITLAYKGVVDEMNRYEPARWQNAAKQRTDVGDLKLSDAERPKQTFDQSPFTLKDDTREVQFMHWGWAHTRGDAFVWLPRERVLCTGDAVVNGAYNNTADANIGNWPKVLDNALKLNPQHVLPGHGASGGSEILAGQRQFMVDLHDAVAAQSKLGRKPEASDIKLPDSDKNWVGGPFKAQVEDAYNEVMQGKPAGDLPHK